MSKNIQVYVVSFAVGSCIRSFTDRLWYSFNDQQVTRITKDDITKTYGGVGGSSRGSMFSSSYTSSTNAYMLMYRKIDPNSNSG